MEELVKKALSDGIGMTKEELNELLNMVYDEGYNSGVCDMEYGTPETDVKHTYDWTE